jgi:hypothetical protein
MNSVNAPLPEKSEPAQLAEHESSWTLVPDALAASGFAVLFADGSFTRAWIPGQA